MKFVKTFEQHASGNIIINTEIPYFTGFYGWEWDGDVDGEVEFLGSDYPELYEELEKKKLLDKFRNALYDNINWKKTYENIAKALVDGPYTRELTPEWCEEINFESLVSPKFYNYSTDRIYADVVLTQEQFDKIYEFAFVEKRDELIKIMKEHSSSYDVEDIEEMYKKNTIGSEFFYILAMILGETVEGNIHAEDVDSLYETIEHNTDLTVDEIAKKVLSGKVNENKEYDVDKNKNYRVKTLSAKRGEDLNISEYPNFSKTGSINGMKRMYYGKSALLVKCGNYIYNVSSNPEIYFDYAE